MPAHKAFCMIFVVAFLFTMTACYYEEASYAPIESGLEARSYIAAQPPDKTEKSADKDKPPPPEKPEVTVRSVTPDFKDAIREKKALNNDAVGWLNIPDTEIDEVILHKPDIEDNNYYLNTSFEGLPDKNGTYCADFRNRFTPAGRKDLSRITTIYGHSWSDDPDGELFAQLKKFRDPEFAEAHPYIFFSTGYENMAWEVFAVFETTIYLPYIEPELSEDMFNRMINIVMASSLYDYNITIGKEDKLLALSTCVFSVKGHDNLPECNDYRFVVMARLVEPDEKLKETAGLSVSGIVLEPDATLSLKSLYAM